MTDHFKYKKKLILIFSFVFLVGLITGIITLTQLKNSLNIDSISDFLLIDCVKGNVGFFIFFFKRLLNCVLVFSIIFLMCLWFYSSFLSYVYVFYRAFKFGMNITIFMLLYGIGGILPVILIYFPIQIVLNFVLINYCSCLIEFASCRRGVGPRRRFNYEFCFWFFIIIVAVCLLESLIVPPLIKNLILII